MPIRFHNKNIYQTEKDFESLNKIFTSNVLGELNWKDRKIRALSIAILPNRYFCIDSGDQFSEDFLALQAKKHGLDYGDTGLWLDSILHKGFLEYSGKLFRVHAENDTLLRLDQRRPIYFFGQVPRYYLDLRE